MFPPEQDPDERPLSDDPLEEVRLQNELLKLKLQAELGAEFGGDLSLLPPEVEQQFLQQVLLFQRAQEDAEPVSLGQHIGREKWPEADSFSSENELQQAWSALQTSLRTKRVYVSFLAEYPLSLKWDFVTQELMLHRSTMFGGLGNIMGEDAGEGAEADQTLAMFEGPPQKFFGPQQVEARTDQEEDFQPFSSDKGDYSEADDSAPVELPKAMGGVVGFIYEEFHPNHTYDIERQVHFGLKTFFENRFSEWSSEFSNPLVTDKGDRIAQKEFFEKAARFHDLFAGIREWEFSPAETSWQVDEKDEGTSLAGMGHVEGNIRYIAILEDGSESEVYGPCKLYLECSDGWWSIFFFYLHGFSWD